MAQWFFGRFDVQKFQQDHVYASDYTTNAFIAWIGYLISGFARELDETYVEDDATIGKTLEDFIDLMKTRVADAEQLLAEVKKRSGDLKPR